MPRDRSPCPGSAPGRGGRAARWRDNGGVTGTDTRELAPLRPRLPSPLHEVA
ncbi:hypothetical protein GTY88_35330, partial [Streptomyces sp. SID5926]|nr:hypothetical protein [Streptomyces sp. SID5926]